ncbi:hypothetical protein [Lactobacillus kitasatonis]|uniref:hypothetical protein n=1 Tax=Lactobacillus kitasatonis TaxID=237446 RepID=UPI000AFEFD06|nr:hypothetical protein [Lactobacillus kitasatonis]
MKNRIKNILGAIISILGLGALIFVAYLRIQAHEYGALVWNILGIIILLIATYVYFRDAITNSTDANIEEDPEIKKIETNSKAKSFDILSNLSFWCGLVLMIFASHQLKEAPQFSYILFAISGTLTAIWLITLVTQLFYIFKYGKE